MIALRKKWQEALVLLLSSLQCYCEFNASVGSQNVELSRNEPFNFIHHFISCCSPHSSAYSKPYFLAMRKKLTNPTAQGRGNSKGSASNHPVPVPVPVTDICFDTGAFLEVPQRSKVHLIYRGEFWKLALVDSSGYCRRPLCLMSNFLYLYLMPVDLFECILF